MASGELRDIEALRGGLAGWVGAHGELIPGGPTSGPPLHLTGVTHATAGLANETVLVELGPDHPGLAVRLQPLELTFPTYDLATQARVQVAVAAAGVPAPAPAVVVTDPQWIGTPFLVMPRVSGHIPGPAPVFDRWITGADPEGQCLIHDGLIDTLAAVHGVDWAAHDLAPVLPGPTLSAALDYWAAYVEWAGGGAPLPALVEALSWCRAHQPTEADPAGSPPVLLWGDPRLGNLVFDDDLRVHAVLDWELAALGPPEMDLGWYFGLDAMMDELFGRRVPGFPERAGALERYQSRSGHTVHNLAWHEIFALVRALAINDRQQRIAAASGQRYVGGAPAADAALDPLARVLLARLAAAG
ncbi:MAG TPA: phosphotransferase family protein [Acidimicrobiales bacterium]|nr:phosphotransferase family protein [Acidimicrobiales bacterium]